MQPPLSVGCFATDTRVQVARRQHDAHVGPRGQQVVDRALQDRRAVVRAGRTAVAEVDDQRRERVRAVDDVAQGVEHAAGEAAARGVAHRFAGQLNKDEVCLAGGVVFGAAAGLAATTRGHGRAQGAVSDPGHGPGAGRLRVARVVQRIWSRRVVQLTIPRVLVHGAAVSVGRTRGRVDRLSRQLAAIAKAGRPLPGATDADVLIPEEPPSRVASRALVLRVQERTAVVNDGHHGPMAVAGQRRGVDGRAFLRHIQSLVAAFARQRQHDTADKRRLQQIEHPRGAHERGDMRPRTACGTLGQAQEGLGRPDPVLEPQPTPPGLATISMFTVQRVQLELDDTTEVAPMGCRLGIGPR